MDDLSKDSNLCRSAIKDIGILALHQWQVHEGASLEAIVNEPHAHRERSINQIVAYFEKSMQANSCPRSVIEKNLPMVRHTFETLMEI